MKKAMARRDGCRMAALRRVWQKEGQKKW